MTILVREATPDDLPALRTLFLEARRATFVWQREDERAIDDYDRATEGELVLVATIDAIVVGFVSCWLPENFVHNLFVAPDRLRQGIGTALASAALSRLGRPAWLKCDRRNENAVAFYRASGWEVYEEKAEPNVDWIPFMKRS